ncbi:hypothetical protein GCM10028796_23200 [Ramlibacter monticola]|uniref:Uncharacterized protein n=1 Tax=Ramlibacter monticola TaxID=1926872 RepID=A0A937CV24_9BURK|nr:hypothetical protein [Ramlibacter monticola]MBL0392567.1 hypothetical protein [Ramlibacter monticola]
MNKSQSPATQSRQSRKSCAVSKASPPAVRSSEQPSPGNQAELAAVQARMPACLGAKVVTGLPRGRF